MHYTKQKTLETLRTVLVKFNPKDGRGGKGEELYCVEIYYDHVTEYWSILIRDIWNHQILGEISSEKWPFLPMHLENEDVFEDRFQ